MTDAQPKRPRGRPPGQTKRNLTVRLEVLLEPKDLAALDRLTGGECSRGEVIRRLIREADQQ